MLVGVYTERMHNRAKLRPTLSRAHVGPKVFSWPGHLSNRSSIGLSLSWSGCLLVRASLGLALSLYSNLAKIGTNFSSYPNHPTYSYNSHSQQDHGRQVCGEQHLPRISSLNRKDTNGEGHKRQDPDNLLEFVIPIRDHFPDSFLLPHVML